MTERFCFSRRNKQCRAVPCIKLPDWFACPSAFYRFSAFPRFGLHTLRILLGKPPYLYCCHNRFTCQTKRVRAVPLLPEATQFVAGYFFLAVTIAPIKLSVRCSFQTTLGATGMNSDAKAIKESSGTHFQKQKYGLSATGTFLLTCVVIEIKEIHRDFRTEALRSFNVLP